VGVDRVPKASRCILEEAPSRAALGVLLLVGGAALVYDIPRRRLGVVSKGTLLAGMAVVAVLSLLGAVRAF
jgi:hypothetical protein